MSTYHPQILDSKYHSALRGSRTSGKNSWLQILDMESIFLKKVFCCVRRQNKQTNKKCLKAGRDISKGHRNQLKRDTYWPNLWQFGHQKEYDSNELKYIELDNHKPPPWIHSDTHNETKNQGGVVFTGDNQWIKEGGIIQLSHFEVPNVMVVSGRNIHGC